MIVAAGPRLAIPVPTGPAAGTATQRSEMLEDVERGHIRRTLEDGGWRVAGRLGPPSSSASSRARSKRA